jgi:hypothetical protein
MADNQLRAGLPALPDRMRSLPIDERGYPVPYFVAWVDGKPDHRVMDGKKLPIAVKLGFCWMCGQSLGKYKSFCIGPMCSITRTIAEPPSHLECLRFAARACPWMTRPLAKRREAGLPEHRTIAGEGIRRNPGAVCIWTTLKFKAWKPASGGVLFELGDALHTEWYAQGRPATRAEVDESISTGLPLLYGPAQAQDEAEPGAGAVAELEKRIAIETAWLDRQVWP